MSKLKQSKINYPCGNMSADINVFSGEITLQHPDISMGAGNFQIAVSHVYNSQYVADPYYIQQAGNYQYTQNGTTINAGLGKGWKLNLQQFVIPITATNEYIYIDSLGYRHTFKYYKTENSMPTYYDSEGTGLVLSIDVAKGSHIMEDTTGNKLIFDSNGKITEMISGLNANGKIKKVFEYDASQRLISVYDTRKDCRKIEFKYYPDGKLDAIRCMDCDKVKCTCTSCDRNCANCKIKCTPAEKEKCKKVKCELTYAYDGYGNLKTITKGVPGSYKDIAYFYYDGGKMIYAVDAQSKAALKFDYNGSKVSEISTGAAKLTPITGAAQSSIYCGDGSYSGDGSYCGESYIPVTGYTADMPDGYTNPSLPANYVKTSSTFAYNTGFTSMTNEKGIKLIYFLNEKGLTTSILDATETGAYRTLFKTNGWDVAYDVINNGGLETAAINDKKTCRLYKDNNPLNDGKIKIKNYDTFYNIFFKNGGLSKYIYADRFVLSFWMRVHEEGDGGIKAKLKYVPTQPELYPADTSYTIDTYLDKAPYAWQYVTIPINFDDIFFSFNSMYNNNGGIEVLVDTISGYKNSHMELSFEGLAGVGASVQVADLRIAVGNYSRTYLAGAKFDNAEAIRYTSDNITCDQAIGPDQGIIPGFFMTESDLFLTYKNLYDKGNNTEFDMVCCGGAKRVYVSEIWFKEKNGGYHKLGITKGIPNYYTQSKNRTADESWCVTEAQTKFFGSYYEQETAVGFTTSYAARPVSGESTSSFQTYNNGLHRRVEDAYGVITQNYYDDYGNLTKIEKYRENFLKDAFNNIVNSILNTSLSTERITEKYNYVNGDSNVFEHLREQPTSVTKNGVTREFIYKDPWQTPFRSIAGGADGCTSEWSYNRYHERLTGKSYHATVSGQITSENLTGALLAKNSFTYDTSGNIKTISDQSERKFEFGYNIFGEPENYYECYEKTVGGEVEEVKNLLLAKTISRTLGDDTITQTRYSGTVNNPVTDTETTIIDKYGRPKTHDAVGTTVYSYQDITESSTAAKIEKIVDPYENNNAYNFYYDEDNRPCGYLTTSGFRVQQAARSATEYTIDGLKRMSSIIYDDEDKDVSKKYIEPRIRKTIDTDNGFSNFEKEFETTYDYDALGRLTNVNGEETITFAYSSDTYTSNILKQISYKKNTECVSQQLIKPFIHCNDNTPFFGGKTSRNTEIQTDYEYYQNTGNLKKVTERGTYYKEIFFFDYKNISIGDLDTKTITYDYDELNRLRWEENGKLGATYVYEYDDKTNGNTESDDTGNLTGVKNGVTNAYIKKFKYNNKGQKIRYNSDEDNIIYDNYGNVTNRADIAVVYNGRNLVANYGTNNYQYNHQGVRFKKIANGITKTYYFDGSKMLGEDWTNNVKFRYFYNAEGIAGIRYNNGNYNFLCDTLGNVTKIFRRNQLLAEYNYDAWGNCTINPLSDLPANSSEKFVVYNNPFRWKGYYFDITGTVETANQKGIYLIYTGERTRAYDPEIMQFLDAANVETLLNNVTLPNSLDRNAITSDNIIYYLAALYCIFTMAELYPDPTYDPNAGKSWWSQHWWEAVQWIAFGLALLATAIVAIINPVAGAAMFAFCVKGAVSGLIVGGIIGGIVSAVQGNGFMEGFAYGAIYGAINGYTLAAIMYGVNAGINAKVDAQNCFIAGTLVMTEDGNKPIEEIELGDKVLAYDEVTGEKALKTVTKLFRNETWTKTTLKIKADDDTTDTITSTPGHKYFLPDNKVNREVGEIHEHANYAELSVKWVSACNLKYGDKILFASGKYGVVTDVNTEQLDKPIAIYNFEVEDFHTYYVGEHSVCTHNASCNLEPGTKEWNQAVKDIKNSANSKGKLNYTVKNQNTAEMLMRDAGLPYQGKGFIQGQTPYKMGFELHGIDNSVGMPHFKFWSGRTSGHVYWSGG